MQKRLQLPPPQKDLDFPLMKALELRRSIRRWKDEDVSEQHLSNILWAAIGLTKIPKKGKTKRTAPSACNTQCIKIYVTSKKGLFLYDENEHTLTQISSKNMMEKIGTQKMMHSAPLGLIYVSDYSKMSTLFRSDEIRWFYSGTDTAFISQNVYLYCAVAGLGTVVLGLVPRDDLRKAIGLEDQEHIVYTQVVGIPLDH